MESVEKSTEVARWLEAEGGSCRNVGGKAQAVGFGNGKGVAREGGESLGVAWD